MIERCPCVRKEQWDSGQGNHCPEKKNKKQKSLCTCIVYSVGIILMKTIQCHTKSEGCIHQFGRLTQSTSTHKTLIVYVYC